MIVKKNMGGEIRGYEGAQPPKTATAASSPPKTIVMEETPGVKMHMKGAGDAVKSQYTDEVGINSAITLYGEGDKVGGDAARPGYSTQAVQPAAVINPEIEKLRKIHGEGFNEGLYRVVAEMSEEDKRSILKDTPFETISMDGSGERSQMPSPESYWSTASVDNTSIYNVISKQLKLHQEGITNKVNYEKALFEAISRRDDLLGKMDKATKQANLRLELQLYQLESKENKTPEDLDEIARVEDEMDNNWTLLQRDLATEIDDINKSMGTVPRYVSKDYTTSARIYKNAQDLQENLKYYLGDYIGRTLGGGIESTVNIFRENGSRDRFFEALWDGSEGDWKEAAKDLGVDVFQIGELVLNVYGGGAGAKAFLKGSLAKGIGKREAMKMAMTSAMSTMKGVGKQMINPTLRNLVGKASILTFMPDITKVPGYAEIAYKMASDPKNAQMYAMELMNDYAAMTAYGSDNISRESLDRLKEAAPGDNLWLTETDDYLASRLFNNMNEAFAHFNPEIMEQRIAEIAQLESKPSGVNSIGEPSKEADIKELPKKETPEPVVAEVNTVVPEAVEPAPQAVAEVNELGYSPADQALWDRSQKVYSDFKESTKDKSYYDYLRRQNGR